MKRKINGFIKKFRLHKFKYLNQFLFRVVIVISVIISIIVFKKIDIKSTNTILEKIYYGISQNFNIQDQGDKIFKKTQEIIESSSKFIKIYTNSK